jgi:hypothetical protein
MGSCFCKNSEMVLVGLDENLKNRTIVLIVMFGKERLTYELTCQQFVKACIDADTFHKRIIQLIHVENDIESNLYINVPRKLWNVISSNAKAAHDGVRSMYATY